MSASDSTSHGPVDSPTDTPMDMGADTKEQPASQAPEPGASSASSPQPSSVANPASGQPVRKPRRGDRLEVVVQKIDHRGRVWGQSGEWEILLPRGLPGQRVDAEVRKRRRSRIEAVPLKVLEESPEAVVAPCAHERSCGGCRFQNWEYSAQLAHKRRMVQRALAAALPSSEDLVVEPVIACESIFHYRNKMDFTFSNRRWIELDEPEGVERDFALGLHVPGVHSKVIDIKECHIQMSVGNPILSTVRELARERKISAWDTREHTGLLRHLVMRFAPTTEELMVNLVTTEEAPEIIDPLVEELLRRHPEITTVVQNITDRLSLVAVGDRQRILFGEGILHERLLDLEFTISTDSFFQTNTGQAARLLQMVRSEAQVEAQHVVYDLYCGAGAFALALAGQAREVWGFEWVEAAVEDARRNARNNDIHNCRFVAGDMADLLRPEALKELGAPAPDICIVDPPRAGVHPSVLQVLLQWMPQRIVWISCRIESAAEDLAQLVQAGYALDYVQPLDMFPHTPHVECVVVLERRVLKEPRDEPCDDVADA